MNQAIHLQFSLIQKNGKTQENYLDLLRSSAKETGSIACMGLDPVLESMGKDPERIYSLPGKFKPLFELMKTEGVLPGSFKPNLGFYLKHDVPQLQSFGGSHALSGVIAHIKHTLPGIPIIIDAKTGDIAKSSANYATACHGWGANATTVSPYMGTDSVGPYAEHTLTIDRPPMGSYVLCRTSNPGARDLQNLMVQGEDGELKPLYMHVAQKIVDWSKDRPGIGAVIGATSLEELEKLVKFFQPHDIPLLIPGVGGQGGKADEVMDVLYGVEYELELVRINSSSGLTHPWYKKGKPCPKNWSGAIVENLAKLNEAIGYNSKKAA